MKKTITKKKVKKPTIKKPVKVVSEPESEFSLSLNIGGKVWQSQGDTILECLEKLNPSIWMTRGIITLTSGDKKAERYLQIKQMRNVFKGNKMHKIILAKWLRLLLR